MRITGSAVLAMVLAAYSSAGGTQSGAHEPRFEVVSIKRNVSDSFAANWMDRPDGGFRATNIQVRLLVARAYPPTIPAELVGMPEWTRTERYDVVATSSVSRATPDDRAAMLRAMLAEHFKLIMHVENREQPVYELLIAREDRRLGRGLTPTEIDCEAQRAADKPQPPPRPDGPAPRCVLVSFRDRLEGDGTMEDLARFLRPFAGRRILDKSGLSGFYRVTMNFDPASSLRGPETAVTPSENARSLFTAIQEDLGLKLNPTRSAVATIVIDRIERPTGNSEQASEPHLKGLPEPVNVSRQH